MIPTLDRLTATEREAVRQARGTLDRANALWQELAQIPKGDPDHRAAQSQLGEVAQAVECAQRDADLADAALAAAILRARDQIRLARREGLAQFNRKLDQSLEAALRARRSVIDYNEQTSRLMGDSTAEQSVGWGSLEGLDEWRAIMRADGLL
jgi:hypothetical protein